MARDGSDGGAPSALAAPVIGDDGARVLAEALPKAALLTTLDLEANVIGDAGAAALAEALPKATQLTRLLVEANLIGDAGAAALDSAIVRAALPSVERRTKDAEAEL